MKELLTIQESARIAGVSRQTLYNWIRQGVLKYTQLGHFKVFGKEDLWIASKIMEMRGGKFKRGKRE